MDDRSNSSAWAEVQKMILAYLEDILFKIEWRYGECRAPFLYPPEFELKENIGKDAEYKCIITKDFGDFEKKVYKSTNPGELLKIIQQDIGSKYSAE